jgi:hypothetical protein
MDRKAKQIDHFVGVRADEMRAEDSAAVFLDDRLVSVHRLGDARAGYQSGWPSRKGLYD